MNDMTEHERERLRQQYGYQEKSASKSSTAQSVERMHELWNESQEDNQATGCLPRLLHWWWVIWHGFP